MTGSANWGDTFRTASADAMGAYRDTLLEPVFRPWAELLLDTMKLMPGERLVDVATGPGTVAQAASERLGPTGQVTACDISPAMLAIAREFPPQADAAPIDYVISPAAPLSVASDSLDVAVCQQGLQFVPDRPAAIAELYRVLRPGGRLAVAVWASIEECPSVAALERAIREQLGDEIADRYRTGPWGMPEASVWTDLLTAAGFVEVSAEKCCLIAVFPGGVTQLSRSLAASGVAADVAQLGADDRAALDRRIAHHLEPLMVGDAVEAAWHSNVVTAVKRNDEAFD